MKRLDKHFRKMRKEQRIWDVRFYNENGELDGYVFKATAKDARELLEFLKRAQEAEPDRIQNLEMVDVLDSTWSLDDVRQAIEERYSD